MRLQPALRGRHLLVIDILCVGVAFVVSFALRLDAPSVAFSAFLQRFAWFVLPLIAIRISSNLGFHLYQRMWRYASIEEMQAIVLAASTGSVAFGLMLLALSFGGPAWPAYGFPRSIVGIEWLLSTALVGGSRFSLRVIRARRWVAGRRLDPSDISSIKRVLMVGAGDAGAMVAKELQPRRALAMEPVGFLDAAPDKQGKWIYGVQVLGNRAALTRLVERTLANRVIVAMPTAPGTVIREIVQVLSLIHI